jgi:hypothetical protein
MALPVSPPSVDLLGVPPSISDTTNFDARADQHVQAVANMVPQVNAATVNVYANTVIAYQSAADAAAQAAAAAASANAAGLSTGVVPWVNNTAYAKYVVVVSPLDFQNYRRSISSGSLTTVDPSLDLTGWRMINYVAPWAVKSGAYTAVQGDRLMINTGSAPVAISLPATPVAGVSQVLFKDYAGTFGINNLTVLRNGNNIEGLAQDLIVSQNFRSFGLAFIDSTRGWVIL